MASANQPTSAFIRRLNQVSAGAPQRIGFRTALVEATPALLVVVTLPNPDPQLAQAAISAGANALLVRLDLEDESKDAAVLRSLLNVTGDVPCGVLLARASGTRVARIDSWRSAGIDFVVVGIDSDPSVLKIHGLGKVITIDDSVGADLIRSLNDLPFDAIEASLAKPDEVGQPLVIRDVMRYRSLSMMVHKPIVVRADRHIAPQDVAVLRDAKVEALSIDARQTGTDRDSIRKVTAEFVQEVRNLGAARGRTVQSTIPAIPRAGSRPSFPQEPAVEPEEE